MKSKKSINHAIFLHHRQALGTQIEDILIYSDKCGEMDNLE